MDGFESHFINAEDRLRLHAREYAPRGGPNELLPVVCLPGLSRNVRDFHAFALLTSQDPDSPRRVISVDYRGRGLSAYDPDPAHYNLVVECRDVVTVLAARGISRAIFVGTSRGGLILHLMASTTPDVIAGAVLNDIGPEIEADGLRDIRDYLSRRSTPHDRSATAQTLEAVHGATFPALTETDWLDMADALYRIDGNGLIPDFDPRLTEQIAAIDFSKPLPTLWPQFELLAKVPLLLIRGEHSRLLSQETLTRMKYAAPSAKTLTAPGQGHAPLLHNATVFPAVRTFLNSLQS